MKTRVLIVDDSAVMRKLLSHLINSTSDLEVVGAAADGQSALLLVEQLKPDVLTLDVAMPRMGGLEFLEQLMARRAIPVVMVSAFTEKASETTLKALELGAVDFIGKPLSNSPGNFDDYLLELADKIRAAKNSRPRRSHLSPSLSPQPSSSRPLSGRTVAHPPVRVTGGASKVLFVGASTGGTEAIKQFLLGFPADCPPILIVQHMPETFTASFAKRLDSVCAPRVIEAQGGEQVLPGNVYVAPGHSHLMVRRAGGGLQTELSASAPVNRHRPSVDVLFNSAAEVVGGSAVGVILTGMGKDGAQGMLAMRKAGAKTFAQDEASCVVFGMPREAVLIGAVDEVAGLDDLARRVLGFLGRNVAAH